VSERDGGSVWVIKEYVRDSRLKESVSNAYHQEEEEEEKAEVEEKKRGEVH
jgi:hypothetical protein